MPNESTMPDGHVHPLTASNCRSHPSSANCNHVYPNAANCSYDAYTVASANIYDYTGNLRGRVDLRYDRACQSNWARTIIYGAAWDLAATVCAGSFAYGCPGDRDEYDAFGTYVWSSMIWAPVQCAQAAGVIYNFGSVTGCY